jgi:peptide-methionine (R)-S-oxide reductase
MTDKLHKSDEEWRAELSDDEYAVCRLKHTERPFSGEYYASKDDGVYLCRCCGEQLFSSDTKYDSGSGWPSFYAPLAEGIVREEADNSHGMQRVEILCNRCGSHLGHVFSDGPQPTGQRYCVNSLSLRLKRK